MKIKDETQVIVIGAGAIGCSIAYQLARKGAAVTVLESGAIGNGASTANLGLTWVQEKLPAHYMELNMAGVQLHARFAEHYDEDVGFRMPGGVVICLSEADLQRSVEIQTELKQNSRKYQSILLTPAEVRDLEPQVSPDIAGGFYSPHDGHINPLKLVTNLKRLAEKHGVKFLQFSPAIRILKGEEGIQGVAVADGQISAQSVVVAAGTGSPDLLKPLGVHLPLKMVRGQILVTARTRQLLNHPTVNIRQTVEGNILMGTTHEEVGADRSTTVEAARKIAGDGILTFPVLKDIPILRQFSGIRPMPVDKLPYLGAVEQIPGLYIAVSHSGITLSILHGKVISELIVDGSTSIPIDCYRPDRHSNHKER